MPEDRKTEFNTDWYEIWMEQSKEYFAEAANNMSALFDKNTFMNPEKHTQQINEWMSKLKSNWQFSEPNEAQPSMQVYWARLEKMYNEALALMMSEWNKGAEQGKPITNIEDLHKLWLSCCQKIYQQSLQSNVYQESYEKFMEAALNFWQTNLTK